MVAVTESSARASLAELFTEVPVCHALVQSAMTTRRGHLVVDDPASARAAVLFYGGVVIYAGDAGCERAHELVCAFPVQPTIIGYSEAWNRLLERTFGERLSSTTRYYLPSAGRDRSVAAELLRRGTIVWERLTAEAYERLEGDLGWEHHKYHYESREAFLRDGNCCIARVGEAVVSAASSYVDSETWVECQATTAEAYRRRGYALAVSAAYLDQCTRKGKEVPWDAANQASVALAKKLGYGEVREYPTYSLFPEQ